MSLSPSYHCPGAVKLCTETTVAGDDKFRFYINLPAPPLKGLCQFSYTDIVNTGHSLFKLISESCRQRSSCDNQVELYP